MLRELVQIFQSSIHPPKYGKFGADNKCYFNYDLVANDPGYKVVINRWTSRIGNYNLKNGVFLDLGSGTSDYLKNSLPREARIIHADLTPIAVESSDTPLVCDLRDPLPFPDESINGIHCKDVITHIPQNQRQKLFDEIRRVSVIDGGGLLLTSGLISNTINRFNQAVSVDSIALGLEKSGFRITLLDTWVPQLPTSDWYFKSQNPMTRFIIQAE